MFSLKFNLTSQKLKKSQVPSILLAVGLVITSLSGCVNNSASPEVSHQSNCIIAHSNQLSVAIENSHQVLLDQSCHVDYLANFESLVIIASGEPNSHNLDKLGRHTQWLVSQDLITQKESELLLRKYFSPQLVSLEYNTKFNTYSFCSMGKEAKQIEQMLKQELDQKRLGIAEALGDRKTYQLAVKEYQSITVFLKSTLNACTAKN
jgi:hypothetical protein